MTADANSPSRAARVWKRTWIGALMVGALTGLFLWVERSGDALPILIVAAVLTTVALVELERIAALGRRGWIARLSLALSVMLVTGVMELRSTLPDGTILSGLSWPLRVAAAFLTALMVATLRGPGPVAEGSAEIGDGSRVRETLRTALVAVWVVCPLFLLAPLWAAYGLSGLIALVVLSKVGDIAGYYVGNAIGRTHPFPSISPGKTTAGCVGSLVAGVAVAVVLVSMGTLPPARFGFLGAALAGAAINLASQAGDLLESWVKRRSGAKDSGPWFGPAGGVLDLVDSLLLSVPTALLIWPLLLT